MKNGRPFGAALRREREGRGVALEAVAASTKFRLSVLEDLEANGLSNVSSDFHRHALLRAYATAIGMPPEDILAKYFRYDAEESAGDNPRRALRLVVEPEGRWTIRSVSTMLTAVADTCVVLLLAGLVTELTRTNPWVIGGAVALAYHALSTATLGCSPASWYANYVMFGGGMRRRRRDGSRLASSDKASAISRS